jgi:1,3-beta-galactosyl-N-acetylhexosamine phosphorylase
MVNGTGRVTLPAEAGMEKEVPLFARKWGIDAIRDSDGTALTRELLTMGYDVYSTLCLIREDPVYAKAHPEELQEMYLLSNPATALSSEVTIDPLAGYFREQFLLDTVHDPARWWEVYDRTNGEIVPAERWKYEAGFVTIRGCRRWHRYTVSFLAYQIWEPVSMFNHLTNSWTTEHRMPLDPRHPGARRRLREILEAWLAAHPHTRVVRFTTFFYNFDLIYDDTGRERQVDWFGYLSCVSPEAFTQFERDMGYALRAEDFIDGGYYNSPFRVPSRQYLDWMEFQQRFVTELAGTCVEMVHAAGKKAIMFLGDHWIGTEPYGRHFPRIGLDGVVGSVGDGVTLRMIADIPVPMREGRFLPYFFPDVFREGGDPCGRFITVWNKARRALLHCALDRMGFGGYLSLAARFPRFVDLVGRACDEFRELWDRRGGAASCKAPFKVAFLNAWGSLRAWQCYQVTHCSWDQRAYSYLGLLEAVSGMNVDVVFLGFDQVLAEGMPDDVGVVINAGDAGTSWSGGQYWESPLLQEVVREWVHTGGGFIGVGEPTAWEGNGRFFQLDDVLGVQKERGFSLGHRKTPLELHDGHFIIGRREGIEPGEEVPGVYPTGLDTLVLAERNRSVTLSANACGGGRSVYLAGLPFSLENARLLRRCLFWAAGREDAACAWASDSPFIESAYYPEAKRGIAINLSAQRQSGILTSDSGRSLEVRLEPYGRLWFAPEDFA